MTSQIPKNQNYNVHKSAIVTLKSQSWYTYVLLSLKALKEFELMWV